MDSGKEKASNWWEPKHLTGECYTEEESASVTPAPKELSSFILLSDLPKSVGLLHYPPH